MKSHFLLKLAVIAIGIVILVACIGLPFLLRINNGQVIEYTAVEWLILMIAYTTAIPFYFAWWQVLKILNLIAKNTAFSNLSLFALKKIKVAAFIISAIYGTVGLSLFYLIAENEDAPGVIIIGLAIIAVPLVFGIFVSVLQKLFAQAINYKKENDLTI